MSFLIKRQFLTIENCVYVIAAAQGLRGVQLDGSLSIVVWRKEGCFGGWAAGLALCMEGRLLSKVSLFCSKTARYLWAWRLLTLKAAAAFLWHSSLFRPFSYQQVAVVGLLLYSVWAVLQRPCAARPPCLQVRRNVQIIGGDKSALSIICPPPTVFWMGFYTDISWESRCSSEMKVWGHLCHILVVFEVPARPQVKEMSGNS